MNKAGERIRYLRKSKKMSLDKLSKVTGVSRAAISRYENYQADISGDSLIAIAAFFEVTTDYLLGVTDYY